MDRGWDQLFCIQRIKKESLKDLREEWGARFKFFAAFGLWVKMCVLWRREQTWWAS